MMLLSLFASFCLLASVVAFDVARERRPSRSALLTLLCSWGFLAMAIGMAGMMWRKLP